MKRKMDSHASNERSNEERHQEPEEEKMHRKRTSTSLDRNTIPKSFSFTTFDAFLTLKRNSVCSKWMP